MYTNPQRRSHNLTRKLRKQAGRWLRELREKRGLSQRDLAQKVGLENSVLISQIENGSGRIPPDRYLAWAKALGVEPPVFVRELMSHYDPVTYNIMFGHEPNNNVSATKAKRPHAQSSTIRRDAGAAAVDKVIGQEVKAPTPTIIR